MLDDVVPVTRTPPGVPGTPGCGSVPPPQSAPLTRQFSGAPGPAPRNPKVALAPGARLPLYSRLVNVWCVPLEVSRASQELPMLVPTGRSTSTRQPPIAVAPPLVTVNRPYQPDPQSD